MQIAIIMNDAISRDELSLSMSWHTEDYNITVYSVLSHRVWTASCLILARDIMTGVDEI